MADLWDTTKPANAVYILTGQLGIRNNWKALVKTIGNDHYEMGTSEDDGPTEGEHRQLSLYELGSDPGNVANTGFVYTKNDSGDTELYYEDQAAEVGQITEDGAIVESVPLVAALSFDNSAIAGTYTPTSEYVLDSNNITSIQKSGLLSPARDVWTITFASALPSDYLITSNTSNGYVGPYTTSDKTVNSLIITMVQYSGYATAILQVLCYGS